MPCPLATGPAGTSPLREEITTQPGAHEGEGRLGSPCAEYVPKFGTIKYQRAGTGRSEA
jgi:hypothetical protein